MKSRICVRWGSGESTKRRDVAPPPEMAPMPWKRGPGDEVTIGIGVSGPGGGGLGGVGDGLGAGGAILDPPSQTFHVPYGGWQCGAPAWCQSQHERVPWPGLKFHTVHSSSRHAAQHARADVAAFGVMLSHCKPLMLCGKAGHEDCARAAANSKNHAASTFMT